NYTINFIVNIIKKIISKNYVVVFKKDIYFRVDPLTVSELVDKPLKAKVYSGGCAREIYGNVQKEK
ncbi:class I SAM-dependent methyltransferase, partial [Francisella tularensis subsp. holarctica]|nr:class I SAM-dependent methyltransferase [Francisella tularensis subsp. holarctica]